MVKFIHLSDLHIHSTEKEDNTNCSLAVGNIIYKYKNDEDNEKPVVLITGDIVDDGKEEQYQNAVKILKPLIDNRFRVLACPGNHDYGQFGNFYTEESQALFQKYILGELLQIPRAKRLDVKMEDLYPMVDLIQDVLFIGLDSVVGNEDQFLHFASGEVGAAQRKSLADILKTNAGTERKVVVYFHHHPFQRDIGLEMDDARKVLRLLTNQADFVCFGHKHKSEVWDSEHNIDWMLASGKTTSRNRQYKFQFRQVVIDGDNNEVSMVTYSV